MEMSEAEKVTVETLPQFVEETMKVISDSATKACLRL
jgi:hypothetical protein